MALTAAEKVSVKRALGYNSASEALYPIIPPPYSLNQVLDTLPAETETEVRSILTRLTAIETALDTAIGRLKAIQVGSIKLNDQETRQLRAERAAWRRELSTLLGVPLARAPGQIVVV
jgi:hypothetical protein